MKNIILFASIGILLFGGLLWSVITWQGGNRYFSLRRNDITISNSDQKVYVAHEGDGSVLVIDSNTQRPIKSIDLSQQYYGKYLTYSAHNVQVSPQGTIVAVTANISESSSNSHGREMLNNDQLILIDPLTDTIIERIDLGIGMHLAHVVLDPTDTFAYIASQEKGIIFIVNLLTKKVTQEVKFLDESQPHGMRLSPDGKNLFAALIGEESIGIMDTKDFTIEYIPVGDKAVQVAVTPDGKYLFASLYMTRSIARYDLINKKIAIIPLPDGAQGPVQIYPTPDSRFLVVADQGYYFDQTINDQIYIIDIVAKKVIKSYTGGQAPHGVVVSPDGQKVYITNLLSNTISVVDISAEKVISTIAVGEKPNGISIRTKGKGGTP